MPGGPSRTTFSLPARKSSWPRCWISVFLTERWKVKSNSSSVLRAGNRAALIRPSPPCASREWVLGRKQRLGEALIAPLLLRGRARRAWAAPARRRAPSAPGTGARARCWCSCDQRVIGGQRPRARRRGSAGSPRRSRSCAGVLDRGDRAVPGERPRACRQASSPVSSATAVTSVCETRTSTRRPASAGSSE